MPSSLIASTLEQTIRHYGEDANALTVAAKHHISRPGKRTRAKLLFAASPLTKNSPALIHAAAAVELIHEASIVHDDIQDRTEYRRGNKTVWQVGFIPVGKDGYFIPLIGCGSVGSGSQCCAVEKDFQ